MRPPRHLALEMNRAYVQFQKSQALQVWDPSGELMCRFSHTGLQHRGSSLRDDWIIGEGHFFVNLKVSACKAGTRWDFLCRKRPWLAPFLHSPSTLLAQAGVQDTTSQQAWVCPAPKALPLHCWGQGHTLPSALSHCLPKAGGWAESTQEVIKGHHPLDLVARGLCFWAPQDYNNQKDLSGKATTPKTLPREQTDTHPRSACGKGPSACPGASTWGTGFKFATHVEPTDVLSGNSGQRAPSLSPPLASPQITHASQKGDYTLVWSPNFCNFHTGATPDLPVFTVVEP